MTVVQRVEVKEAMERLPDLVKAAMRGEDICIVVEGQQTVRLVPVAGRQAHFGSAKGLVSIGVDFDKPLDDFDEYTR